MTLEFRPPFSFNPNDETPSQRSLENVNQSISGLGNFAERYGQEQHQNRVQDAILALHKQQADRERMDWERQNTGTLPMQGDGRTGSVDMAPGGTSSWNPSPLDMGRQPFAQSPNYAQPQNPAPSGLAQAPFPQMASAGTPDTGWNTPQASPASFSGPQTPQPLHAPGADLTAHFNAWKQQGGGPYNHPEMSGQMSEPNNPMAQWNQYASIPGAKNRAEYSLFNKQAGTEGLQASEAAKNQAMADFYSGKTGHLGDPKPASIRFGEQNDQYTQKRLTQLGDALDPSKQRAGAFGVSKQVFDRAERLESLASAYKDGNLDSRQVEELAIGLNAMLSGANVGNAQQVKSLVPNTVWGNAQKTAEWLTNQPRGLQQQAFVNRMLGSITREKSTAFDQIKRTQFQRISRYADLERKSPDDFENVLRSSGIDPEEYRSWKGNGYKPISAVQTPDASAGGLPGKIKVSNGKESLWIDPMDAADAAKDGYQ